MNHTIIPVTAQGEPIPLIRLGQGREEAPQESPESFIGQAFIMNTKSRSGPLETVQTLAQKMAVVAYKAPKCDAPTPEYLAEQDARAELELAALRAEPLPLVSQKGFKAGVFATCLGGAFLGALFFGCGALICGCVAAGCAGFVAGMLMTEDWK